MFMQNILIRLCSQGLGATDINNPPPRRAQVSNLGREDRGLLLKTEVNGRSSRDTPPLAGSSSTAHNETRFSLQ